MFWLEIQKQYKATNTKQIGLQIQQQVCFHHKYLGQCIFLQNVTCHNGHTISEGNHHIYFCIRILFIFNFARLHHTTSYEKLLFTRLYTALLFIYLFF